MKATPRRLLPFFCLAWCVVMLGSRLGLFLDYSRNPLWQAELADTEGRYLHYGWPASNISGHMPLTPVLADQARLHSASWGQGLVVAVELAPILLSFVIGSTLGGAPAGWIAAAIASGFDPRDPVNPPRPLLFETTVYACLLTLVAAALTREKERPSAMSSALLGWTIGLTLLCRSPLFLFPAALFCSDVSPRLGGEASWTERWPVLAVPALLLAPWICMNWRVYGRFIPLENGREICNVLTGAAGLVQTWQPNFMPLYMQGAIPHPYLLAAQWVVQHPFRYSFAVSARIAYAFSMHPALWTVSLAALWLKRSLPSARRLALFLGYFAGIYCLMPIEPRYFEPLWPILAALAGTAAAAALFLGEPPATKRFLDGALIAELLPISAAALGTLFLVAAYPARLRAYQRDPGALSAKAAADPWTWILRGARFEGAGDVCHASDAYAKALRLDPTRENLSDYYRTIRQSLENRLVIMPAAASGAGKKFVLVSQNALMALEYLQQGNSGAARSSVRALKREWFQPSCGAHAVTFEAVPAPVLRSLTQGDLLRALRGLLSDWPSKDRRSLLKCLKPYASGAA